MSRVRREGWVKRTVFIRIGEGGGRWRDWGGWIRGSVVVRWVRIEEMVGWGGLGEWARRVRERRVVWVVRAVRVVVWVRVGMGVGEESRCVVQSRRRWV